jgi:hypothetical protein
MRFTRDTAIAIAIAFLAGWIGPGCAGTGQATRNENENTLWFMRQMVEFIQKKNEVIKDNLPDCSRTYRATLSFIEANLSELVNVFGAFQRFENEATEKEKYDAARQIMTLMGPYLIESMEIQKNFQAACPLEHQQVAALMKAIGVEAKRAAEQASPPDKHAGDTHAP